MAINPDVIARTALTLLTETGLDGLTMRLLADRLGVRAPTLYWHVRSKQHLLDAMAAVMFAEATADLAPPPPGQDWADWLGDGARRLRSELLRYRDGARVFAGTNLAGPDLPRAMELALGVMTRAGLALPDALRSFATLLHYTVGATIEQQARTGADYDGDDPYDPARLLPRFDPERYPLAAEAAREVFLRNDADRDFEHGLQLFLRGLRPDR